MLCRTLSPCSQLPNKALGHPAECPKITHRKSSCLYQRLCLLDLRACGAISTCFPRQIAKQTCWERKRGTFGIFSSNLPTLSNGDSILHSRESACTGWGVEQMESGEEHLQGTSCQLPALWGILPQPHLLPSTAASLEGLQLQR